MKNNGINENLESDFYFIMAHLTNLLEDELLVSNIDLDQFGI